MNKQQLESTSIATKIMSDAETRTISGDRLRHFAGHFATGVAVVATCHGGICYGSTVNAVTCLSLNPPLFLVCLGFGSNTLSAIKSSGHFCIHFLAKEQEAMSRLFATKRQDKFDQVAFQLSTRGSPIIDGVVAAAECVLVDEAPGGDHAILIGAIEEVHVRGGEPLLYHKGAYVGLPETGGRV